MSDPVRRGADAFDHLAFAADREGGRKFGCHEDGGSTICSGVASSLVDGHGAETDQSVWF
jgi:hypothetical protein